MKKWFSVTASAVVLSQVIALGTAEASTTGYDASGDTTISISTGLLNVALPPIGTLMFNAQERLYQTTGTSIPHSYVWVTVNGTPILAIDPPKPVIK
jgi:hypothetical protein